MKSLKFSNPQRAILEGFLLKDTKNYKNFNSSIAGRTFLLEEEVETHRKNISSMENKLAEVEAEYEATLKEIDQMKGSFPFGKLSLIAKKKKLAQDAKDTKDRLLEILHNNIENEKVIYQNCRIRLQELIDKLAEQGVVWEELKRIIMEKIAQGFIILEQPRKAQKRPEFVVPVNQPKKKPNGTNSGEGGRTFKEKNVIDRYELYKIKGLTPAQRREYAKMLKHMLYMDEKCVSPEIAWKIRLALIEANNGKFKNLALNTSSTALFNGIFAYFVQDGGVRYQSDFNKFFNSPNGGVNKKLFFGRRAYEMMALSGFDNDFIKANAGIYAAELEMLFKSPNAIKKILHAVEDNQYTNDQASRIFEFELRREIDRRVQEREKIRQMRSAKNYGK